tara:strand:+ start:56 stop:718 length:663 start_codon:yes stop_codon:yes gene_type:complete
MNTKLFVLALFLVSTQGITLNKDLEDLADDDKEIKNIMASAKVVKTLSKASEKEVAIAAKEAVEKTMTKLDKKEKESSSSSNDNAEKVAEALEKKLVKKATKAEKKGGLKDATKGADKATKKAQKKAEEAIKKIVVKQEAAPGGIVDIVSKALAKSAKQNENKVSNRARVESKVKIMSAGTDTAINTTRSALKSGFKMSRDITAEDSKKELQAVADAPAN